MDDDHGAGLEGTGGAGRGDGAPDLVPHLDLTRLVLGWGEAGGNPLLPGQAAALATALARLLDAAATEGADFARLHELAPDDLAEHWQTVLRFLEILPNAWPAVVMNPARCGPTKRRGSRRPAKWCARTASIRRTSSTSRSRN